LSKIVQRTAFPLWSESLTFTLFFASRQEKTACVLNKFSVHQLKNTGVRRADPPRKKEAAPRKNQGPDESGLWARRGGISRRNKSHPA
jgi:hypothetical protein